MLKNAFLKILRISKEGLV